MNFSLPSNKKHYILLADDDEDDQTFFKDALSEAQLSVQLKIVKDGIELLSTLSNQTLIPHLLFLDINMPQKNGIQCLEEIRQNQSLKSLPIIIYSTSSYKPNIEETFAKGANLYFIKPVSFVQLVDNLKTILNIDWNDFTPSNNFEKFIFNSDLLI